MKSKLKELIIYISEKCKDDPSFGMTKLYKVLFAVDFNNYGIKGKPISEAKYVHLPNGPGPDNIKYIIQSLIESEKIRIIECPYFGRNQKRIIPNVGSDMSLFSEEEKQLVDYIIEHFRQYNATDLSTWTHTLIPWLLTEDGEDIPYHTVFLLKNLEIDRASMAWAIKELEKLREEGYVH